MSPRGAATAAIPKARPYRATARWAGIAGLLAFLAFIFGASYTLYINYRHGDQRLKHINIFLLSCFIAHASYFMINGMIGQDMVLFIGLAGFGVALNGVVKKTAVAPQPVLIQTPNGVTSKTQEFQPV